MPDEDKVKAKMKEIALRVGDTYWDDVAKFAADDAMEMFWAWIKELLDWQDRK